MRERRGLVLVAATHNMPVEIIVRGKFQMGLPESGNPIILAGKAGADPVGASYPKVSCPP